MLGACWLLLDGCCAYCLLCLQSLCLFFFSYDDDTVLSQPVFKSNPSIGRQASVQISSLWLLADDGVVFSLNWDAISTKCFDEMDPDSTVTPAQRVVPVEYAKWRLGSLPVPSQLVLAVGCCA